MTRRYRVYVEVKKKVRGGYINQVGDMVIEPAFDRVFPFNQGLAAVVSNRQYGFINEQGEYVVDPTLTFAFGPENGFGVIQKDGKYGLVDLEGHIAIEPRFDQIGGGITDGMIVFCEGERWGYATTSGEVLLDARFDLATSFSHGLAYVEQGGTSFYIDPTFRRVQAPGQLTGWSGGFDEAGYAVYCPEGKGKGKCGYIETTGRIVVPPIYDRIGRYSNHYALVKSNGKYGYIDRNGTEQIPPRYEFAMKFGVELGAVTRAPLYGGYGFVNRQGKMIVPEQFDDTEVFNHELCWVTTSTQVRYIDRTGKSVWKGKRLLPA